LESAAQGAGLHILREQQRLFYIKGGRAKKEKDL
jgi:hypothetical protein